MLGAFVPDHDKPSASRKRATSSATLKGFVWEKMARATGLEPATSGVTGRHSNQLSYARAASRRPEVGKREGRV